MLSRSVGSVDRPFIGRSAAAALGLLVALIAALAIGATNARASEDTQVADQSSETTQSATATAAPAQTATSVAPAEQEFDPASQASVEPVSPPAETEAAETETSTVPPAAEGPAQQPPATTTQATDPEPVKSEPVESEPESEPTEPAPVEPPSAKAVAQNESVVWQAIFQVQQGCKSHCEGTSQSQTADQVAETTQSATAIAGGTGSPSNATALNQSTTGQFIWQMQLGCVAFCYGTSQTQTANQWAQTTQDATALADGTAAAHNVGSVIQQVWQLQVGCELECYGTSQTQSSTQGQSTTQSATATSETWGPSYPVDLQSLLPAWLVALAENLGVTIQTIWQYEEASCLEHCVGGSQAQDASQRALTSQEARAVAGIPPVEPTPPAAEVPPAEKPAPGVASTAGASPKASSSKTFVERVTATLRRASKDRKGGSRISQRVSASVETSTGATFGDTTVAQTRVEASSHSKARSSSVTDSASTSNSGSAGSTDSQSQPLSGLTESGSEDGGITWLFLGLLAGSLLLLGVAIGRKLRLTRPAL